MCTRTGRVCQWKVGSQWTLENTWWTSSAALNHLLNNQRAEIGAVVGRSALSGNFNNLQYTNSLYLNLVDVSFCLSLDEPALPINVAASLFVLLLVLLYIVHCGTDFSCNYQSVSWGNEKQNLTFVQCIGVPVRVDKYLHNSLNSVVWALIQNFICLVTVGASSLF